MTKQIPIWMRSLMIMKYSKKAPPTSQLEAIKIKKETKTTQLDKEEQESPKVLRRRIISTINMMGTYLIKCWTNLENSMQRTNKILFPKNTKMIQICTGQFKHHFKNQTFNKTRRPTLIWTIKGDSIINQWVI